MYHDDRYAVFGHPIGHSKSPLIHRYFALQTNQAHLSYTAQDVSAERFSDAVLDFFSAGGKGLNCTVPLKELAFEIADQVSERAAVSKAANTLALQDDGRLLGDNTDGIGLVRDLRENLNIDLKGREILVLGAGGACRGILGPLLEEGPERLVIANRTPDRAQALEGEFKNLGPVEAHSFVELKDRAFDLILNATAASLDNELPPLPVGILKQSSCCYDLAYAAEPTAFVCWGLEQGADLCVDGLGMLVEQAAEAFALWRGVRPDSGVVIERLKMKGQKRL